MNKLIQNINKYLKKIDVTILFFLFLITFSSLLVKLLGLLFIYIIRPNFNFKLKERTIPLFYLIILVIPVIQILTQHQLLNKNYGIIVALSTSFWLFSFLVVHQLRVAVDQSGFLKVEQSLQLFFLINILFSFYTLLKIMFITHTINPFMYAGMNYHYHISTGDHIRGVFKDVSTTNACISLFGFIYFFYRQKFLLSIMCLLVVLLTTSNIINLLLLIIVPGFIFLSKSKVNRVMAITLAGIVMLFLIKVSPNNLRYLAEKLYPNKIFKDLPTQNSESIIQSSEGEAKEYVDQLDSKEIEENNIFREIHVKSIDYIAQKRVQDIQSDSQFIKKQIEDSRFYVSFSKRVYGDSLTACTEDPSLMNKPGKIISFMQTVNGLKVDMPTTLLGNGIGNFSSKVAFKASGFSVFGNYPTQFQYISKQLKDNHLKILTYFFIQSRDKHSVMNTPFSVYNQLLGEYGVVGLLLFVFFYIGFYTSKYKQLSFGRILLPVLLFLFLTDYWFEQLSVVIIFELLMFMDLKKAL